MVDQKGLKVAFDGSDKMFFENHPERQAHIRLPFKGEADGEFFSLGQHNRTQRRILIWRIPRASPYFHPEQQPLLKIPFLTFEEEVVDDTDDVLLPIISTIMQEQAQAKGV